MDKLFIFESSIVCLVLLFWIMLYMIRDTDKQMLNILFVKTVIADIIVIILEIPSYLLSGTTGAVNYYLQNIFVALIYAVSGYVCMYWFMYVVNVISSLNNQRLKELSLYSRFWISFPAFVLAVLSCLSPHLNLLFYIDPETNLSFHGSWFFIQRIITYGYTTLGSLIVFFYLLRKGKSYRPVRTFTLISFIVFPLAGGILTILIKGPSTVWAFFAVGLVLIFFDMRIANVSQDGLTRMNNRRVFDDYIAKCINEVRPTKNLYLIMLDIDKFKRINDEYGHIEGDSAISLVADVLKKVCFERDCFLARYGGDEFVILCWEKDEKDVFFIEKEILSSLRHQLVVKKLPYNLTISMGFAERGKDCFGKVNAFIQKADKALYKAKHLTEMMNE